MKKLVLALSTALLISCGNGDVTTQFTNSETKPETETETEGSQYKLKVNKKEAEIILPTSSSITLQEVGQVSIFSLYREPYSGNFNEGNIDNALVINLKGLNIPNRTLVPFEITGIEINDIQSMVLNGVSYQPALTGYFDLGAQGAAGFANLVIIFKADQATEGTETLSLKLLSSITTINSLNVIATINDTSITPATPQPTYTLAKLPALGAVNEGDSAVITLNTTGTVPGALIPWNIIGISPDDIEIMVVNGVMQTPALSGNFILDSVGSATMFVLLKNDLVTEGAETMTVGVVAAGQPTVNISINDTSTTPTPVVDNTNPNIALTSITNFIANTYLTVSGIAVDNIGINSVKWINRINSTVVAQGTASLIKNGNYATWTVVNLPLQTGNNNIEFTATDTSGRTATEIIVVAGNLATTGQSTADIQQPKETLAELAEKWPIWPQMQLVDTNLGWTVSKNNVLGTTSRVKLYRGQDPFPFCAAHAASILHDQHECMSNKTSCENYNRTSGLSLVLASQQQNREILNWHSGGSAFFALSKIVEQKGAASYFDCNYDFITNYRVNKANDFAQVFSMYNAYIASAKTDINRMKYWANEFEWKIMSLGFPKLDLKQITTDKNFKSPDEFFTDLIIPKSCNNVSVNSSKQYKINIVKNPTMSVELGYKQINELLENNIPVMVNICLDAHTGFNNCSKHTHVIIAQSKAINKTTGDTRTVYKLVSTWGEDWHKAHNDGWVFADTFLQGVYEIFWLE